MLKKEGQQIDQLTLDEQNEIMVQALLEILNVYMQFDHPHPDEFGLIAKRTLIKIGRLNK